MLCDHTVGRRTQPAIAGRMEVVEIEPTIIQYGELLEESGQVSEAERVRTFDACFL